LSRLLFSLHHILLWVFLSVNGIPFRFVYIHKLRDWCVLEIYAWAAFEFPFRER
jgi:hypothetical protein